jgi:ABC-type transporter lipoprotein component MlaA
LEVIASKVVDALPDLMRVLINVTLGIGSSA